MWKFPMVSLNGGVKCMNGGWDQFSSNWMGVFYEWGYIQSSSIFIDAFPIPAPCILGYPHDELETPKWAEFSQNEGPMFQSDPTVNWGLVWGSFWLVVWLPFSIFPYIGNNHPNWLSYFQRGGPTTNQVKVVWGEVSIVSMIEVTAVISPDLGSSWKTRGKLCPEMQILPLSAGVSRSTFHMGWGTSIQKPRLVDGFS